MIGRGEKINRKEILCDNRMCIKVAGWLVVNISSDIMDLDQ